MRRGLFFSPVSDAPSISSVHWIFGLGRDIRITLDFGLSWFSPNGTSGSVMLVALLYVAII